MYAAKKRQLGTYFIGAQLNALDNGGRWRQGWREIQEGGYMYTHSCSLHCTAESENIAKQVYPIF